MAMTKEIPGTPLATLGWQRHIDKVRMTFRTDTDQQTEFLFLRALRASALDRMKKIVEDTMMKGNRNGS